MATKTLKEAHKWAYDATDPFIAYVKDSLGLIHVAIASISRTPRQEELVRALVEYDLSAQELDKPSVEHQAQLERAREESELARRELESGFQLLLGHSLLGLWGAFEATIEDLIVAWLENVPESLARDELSGIKVELAAYEAMTQEERLRLIARTILRGDVGIGRFEAGLAAVGLGGSLPAHSRRLIVEMEAVRNVWAHRAGVADARFLRRCPWYSIDLGDRISVTLPQYSEYAAECVTYTLRVLKRCAECLGVGFGHHLPSDKPTDDAV